MLLNGRMNVAIPQKANFKGRHLKYIPKVSEMPWNCRRSKTELQIARHSPSEIKAGDCNSGGLK